MLEHAAFQELAEILVQLHDRHFVVVLLDETADRETELLRRVRMVGPGRGVEHVWRVVTVDLLAFARVVRLHLQHVARASESNPRPAGQGRYRG